MPIPPHFDDPKHWRQRAEEVRVLAEQMSTERTKKMMLKISDDTRSLPSERLCAPSTRQRGGDAPSDP